MYQVFGSLSGSQFVWDGDQWSSNSEKTYQKERSAVAVARRLKQSVQGSDHEIEIRAFNQGVVRIVVVKDGVVYASDPNHWSSLKEQGFSR